MPLRLKGGLRTEKFWNVPRTQPMHGFINKTSVSCCTLTGSLWIQRSKKWPFWQKNTVKRRFLLMIKKLNIRYSVWFLINWSLPVVYFAILQPIHQWIQPQYAHSANNESTCLVNEEVIIDLIIIWAPHTVYFTQEFSNQVCPPFFCCNFYNPFFCRLIWFLSAVVLFCGCSFELLSPFYEAAPKRFPIKCWQGNKGWKE